MDSPCEIVGCFRLFACGDSQFYSIILDEIHTIGQQEGGSVWEQILFLAPCPIMSVFVLSHSRLVKHDPFDLV